MKTRQLFLLAFLLLTLTSVLILHRNAEAWCPMGGVECLYGYVLNGTMICSLAATNFFALIAVLVMTIIFKRIFCGYICPLGAISEFLRAAAKKIGFKQFKIPYSIDKILSLLKYPALAVMLFFTWKLATLVVRDTDPCFAILGFGGEEETMGAYIAFAVFVIAAFLISMPFCRWLCPFAAVMSIFSKISFFKIFRNTESCTDCKVCSRNCPMGIEVHSVKTVNASNCISCMECIDSCPVKKDKPLSWKLFGKINISKPKTTIAVAIPLFVAILILASVLISIPTFIFEKNEPTPQSVQSCNLEIKGITCSGSAKLFVFFLERQDIYQIPGYFKILTAPGSGFVNVKINYDPQKTDEDSIRQAIVQPYYDEQEARWRNSPFEIKGYSLLPDELK
jgi:polyferredoxin